MTPLNLFLYIVAIGVGFACCFFVGWLTIMLMTWLVGRSDARKEGTEEKQ